MDTPTNLNELFEIWQSDLFKLATDMPTEVAYDMAGRLLSCDSDDWYDANRYVLEIFDLVTDLQMAYDPAVYGSQQEVIDDWAQVKKLMAEFEQELVNE